MLREHNRMLQNIHRVWDLVLTVAAFIAAYFIKKYLLPEPWVGLSTKPNYYFLLLLCVIIWYTVFRFSGVYRPYRKRSFAWVAMDVVRSVAVCLLLLLMVIFVIKEQQVSRIFLGLFVILDTALLIGSKWLFYRFLRNLRKRGYNFRYVLIVGCSARAREIVASIRQLSETGYRVMGCLSVDDAEPATCETGEPLPIIGGVAELKRILTEQVVDELVFAEPLRTLPEAAQYIYDAEQMGISVHIMPEWGLKNTGFQPRVGMLRFEETFGLPTLSLTTTPDKDPLIALKNLFDFAVSGLGLVVLALPLALIALAIKASSSGPVFYRQERVGQNGRRFTLYKFRTMIEGAEEMQAELLNRNESDGPVFKIRRDPRIVPGVGTVLRRTSLDELPQLINVFKGDMSLVGPRPPLPGEITKYDAAHRRRLSMKPGITCIWQISPLRNEVGFEEWVRMDLEYIDNWSLWLDFKILIKTLTVVLTGQGR